MDQFKLNLKPSRCTQGDTLLSKYLGLPWAKPTPYLVIYSLPSALFKQIGVISGSTRINNKVLIRQNQNSLIIRAVLARKDYRLQITDCRVQITDYRLSITYHILLITDYRL